MDIDVPDHDGAERPARPAATLVLLRDGADELEVLMMHRGVDTAFGGMWSFPGGVIEPDDVPADSAPDPLPAARRAAVREMCEELGLSVDEASLVWWAHWLPPASSPQRFSTWFFVAPATAAHGDDQIVHDGGADGGEVIDAHWIAPANALAKHTAGDILIATPTFVTLEQLMRYGDVASALADARPAFFATEIAFDDDGVRVCLFSGDAGYGSGDVARPGPRHRVVMHDDAGWRYLRSTV